MDGGEVLTAKQVKELQKRNAQLEGGKPHLKKAIAIFTPHSSDEAMTTAQMSTDKPRSSYNQSEIAECHNHLQQNFTQKAPNLAWVSGITDIRAGGKWHYLCIAGGFLFRRLCLLNRLKPLIKIKPLNILRGL